MKGVMQRDRTLYLAKIVEFLLWAGVTLYAFFVVHNFFGTIDYSPTVGVDDILANISYYISNYNDFGFPASPVIGTGAKYYTRMDGLLTYGPWYFYIGAFFSWLFGFSLILMKSLHLFILIFIAFLTRFVFRGPGRIVTALFLVVILFIFQSAHWPMARPDIVVSLLACLFFVCVYCAIVKSGWGYWFLSGFFAASAAYSHLIAWIIVPVCAFVFFVDRYCRYKESFEKTFFTKDNVKDLFATIGGGLCGVYIYFQTIGFRFYEHFMMLTGYKKMVEGVAPPSYFSVLVRHFQFFTANIRYDEVLLFFLMISIVGSVILLIHSFKVPSVERKMVFGVLLPPLSLFLGYFLSLGTYTNTSSGYVILCHVTGVWLFTATSYVCLQLLLSKKSQFKKYILLVSTLLVTVLVVVLDVDMGLSAKATSHAAMAKKMRRLMVSNSEYIDSVVEMIPPESTAWGDVLFGLENPYKIQLVQADVRGLMFRLGVEERKQYRPEYLVFGYSFNYVPLTQSEWNPLTSIGRIFPSEKYELQGLVFGKPYGEARIYSLKNSGTKKRSSLPYVKVYEPVLRQWGSVLGSPLDVKFVDTESAVVNYGYKREFTSANSTLSGSFPAGWYLVKVGIKRDKDCVPNKLAITVASRRKIKLPSGYLGAAFSCAPYFKDDEDVYILYRHEGGGAYISQFDIGAQASMTEVEVYPIVFFPNLSPPRIERVSLPSLNEWTTQPNVQSELLNKKIVRVVTNEERNGFQVLSPTLIVEKNTDYSFSVDLSIERGAVGVAILDTEKDKFIYASNIPEGKHSFNTRSVKKIKIVIYNNISGQKYDHSEFQFSNPILKKMDETRGGIYAKQLTETMDDNR